MNNATEFYDYTDLKYMGKERLNEILSVFHCIKVPISNKEREFLYFRRFPVDKLILKNSGETEKLKKHEIKLEKAANTITFKKNHIKTYENPYLKKKISEQEKQKTVSKKILNNFPPQRSLLVISLDKNHEKEHLKSVFQIYGKVRRIFSLNFKKQTKNKSKKSYFFHIVIFKNEVSLLKCFDIEKFQYELLQKFMPAFKNMSEIEKNNNFDDYLKSLDAHLELNDELEEDFVNKDGYYVAQKMEFDYEETFKDLKRNKKKEQEHGNYYDFANYHKIPGNKKKKVEEDKYDLNDLSESELDENQFNNPDYLTKRKKKLKLQFRKMKKLKTN